MNIKNIKLWPIPKNGYSFAAWTTYESKIFDFRTGDKVSVLSWFHYDKAIHLDGRIEVSSDKECWQIIMKFGKMDEVIECLTNAARQEGYSTAKRELRSWLRDD